MPKYNAIARARHQGMELVFEYIFGFLTRKEIHTQLITWGFKTTERSTNDILRDYRDLYRDAKRRYNIKLGIQDDDGKEEDLSTNPIGLIEKNIRQLETSLKLAIEKNDFKAIESLIKIQSKLAKDLKAMKGDIDTTIDVNELLNKNDTIASFVYQIDEIYPDLKLKDRLLEFLIENKIT